VRGEVVVEVHVRAADLLQCSLLIHGQLLLNPESVLATVNISVFAEVAWTGYILT
jgi:hypothetical protein